MSTHHLRALAAMLTALCRPAGAQIPFQNLDFSGCLIPPQTVQAPVAAADALPGWTVWFGSSQSAYVAFNLRSMSGISVDVLSFPEPLPPLWYFTVDLQGGQFGYPNLPPTPASISQVGTIPSAASSLQFDARLDIPGTLVVSVGGVGLPLYVLPPTSRFTTYGVDVTAFRGQTVELRFTEWPPPVWNGNADNCLLDSISFSPEPVPEPGALPLLALPTVFLCSFTRGWTRSKRSPDEKEAFICRGEHHP